MFAHAVLKDRYSVDWTRQILALGVLRPLLPPAVRETADALIRARLFAEWTREAEAAPRASRSKYFRFAQITATPEHESVLNRAAYWSPTTFHRLYGRPVHGMDAGFADTVPCLFADIDYREKPPYWGQVYLDLLEAGLEPTMLVTTPRGFHAYWYLEEPIRIRWEREGGLWRPLHGAVKALAWWRDVSFALHRRLIAMGIPADTAGAGTPARLLRFPHRDETRREKGGYAEHYDPSRLWTLDDLNSRIADWKLTRRLSVPMSGRRLSLSEGAEEGERNGACWRLALVLASEHSKAPEAGLRSLLHWAARCTPPYPESEVRHVWAWAVRKVERGEAFSYACRPSERSRKEQGKYARQIVKSKVDEAITAAVAEMRAEGVDDPWKHVMAIVKKSGIPERTVRRRKTELKQIKEHDNDKQPCHTDVKVEQAFAPSNLLL